MVSLEQVLQSASLNSGIEYQRLKEKIIDPLKVADFRNAGQNFIIENMRIKNYYWPKKQPQTRKWVSTSS